MTDASASPPGASAYDSARFAGRSADDLDAQILAAELAVIDRDEQVRRGIETIKERVRSKSGMVLALAGGGAFLLNRLMSGRKKTPGVVPGQPRGSSLLKAWTMLWPLLPAAVQRAIPGGAGGRLIGLALPILGQLFVGRQAAIAESQTPRLPPVRSAERINLGRYMGRWYEVARLPTVNEKNCVADVVTAYAQSGHGLISVLNTCRRRNGRTASARGVARVVGGSRGARLQVSFAPPLLRWLPLAWSDYWILLTADDYRYALVGTPDRRRLWLLSRSPALSQADKERLIDHAQTQGYKTELLVSAPCLGGDDRR